MVNEMFQRKHFMVNLRNKTDDINSEMFLCMWYKNVKEWSENYFMTMLLLRKYYQYHTTMNEYRIRVSFKYISLALHTKKSEQGLEKMDEIFMWYYLNQLCVYFCVYVRLILMLYCYLNQLNLV